MNECLNHVHARTPLVHCITNYVTVNDVANVTPGLRRQPDHVR